MSSDTTKYPFRILANSHWWFGATWVLIALGVIKMVMNYNATGQVLNFGIDFRGGSAYVYKFAERPGSSAPEVIGKVRAALAEKQVQAARIEEFVGNEVQIRTLTGSASGASPEKNAADAKAEADSIEQVLTTKFGNVQLVGSELVGPVIGKSLRIQAFWALIIGNVLIFGYVCWRYNIGGLGGGSIFGLAASFALLHDILILVAAHAWTHTEVNSGFVAALLTVVGYSMNDTVIIFDRIRENMKDLDASQRRNLEMVDQTLEASIWQTMSRSVLTMFFTILPLVTLCIFGGVTLRDFAFSLLVGLVSGGYSSVLQATPLVRWLNRRHIRRAAEAAGRLTPQRSIRRPERPVATPTATAPTRASRPTPATPAPADRTAADAPAADDATADKPADRTAGKTTRAKSSGQRKRRH